MRDDEIAEGSEAEHLERLFARALVVAGGAFWAVAAFAGPYMYGDVSLTASVQTAMWPFIAAVVILIVGWTYERLASVLLFGASAAALVWGALYGWEAGAWMIMAFVLIGPMSTAGVLYLLAARAEERRVLPSEPRPAASRTFEIPVGRGVQVRPH